MGVKSVLECGSGFGELGRILNDRGMDYSGVEPHPVRARYCQEIGLDVQQVLLNEFSGTGRFESVVIDNVLEHVDDSLEVMLSAHRLLEDSGVLVVIVPNRSDIRRVRKKWRDKHLWTPRVHINYFTPANLRAFFTDAGFEPVMFDRSAFRVAKSLPRRLVGAANSRGLFPFGVYLAGLKKV
jgi:2-polyprenyl-3-methyl-5-hydroxy-6-metoxy-1,4-benzoquinol methylase